MTLVTGRFHPQTNKLTAETNDSYLSWYAVDAGWVWLVVCAVTTRLCRQAPIKRRRRVATQRLVGYAKNANPPYISA